MKVERHRYLAHKGRLTGWFFGAASCFVITAAILSGCSEDGARLVEPDPVGGPPLVRRLTESQYRATVADVFDPDIPVVARFARGVRYEGLLAVGTSRAGFSPFAMEQYHAAARGIAAEVVSEDRRGDLLPCTPESDTEFDEACAGAVIEQYAPMLFRRALEQGEKEEFVEITRESFGDLDSFHGALRETLTGLMVSPEFLFRIERVDPDSESSGVYQLDAYSRATRLSYFLTNSTPDAELLRAAGAGELETRDGLRRQVDRLIGSPRFEDAVRAFFHDMLEFAQFDDINKDSEIYPAFNSEVAADAQEQTLRTITHHLLDRKGDYRDLFTTREAFLTRTLGTVYRVPVPTRQGWEHAEFPEYSKRAGIQSHVSFLALHSHPGRSSPTLRGTALREVFLCQPVPDPPPDVDFTAVEFDPSAADTALPTARDRLNRHNEEPACAGCHLITDPPAFPLEKFDGLGTLRTHENDALIDPSGSLDGDEFESPEGLARALRDHPETSRCLTEKMYRYAVGRDTVWGERSYMDYLMEAFAFHDHEVPELMRTIALSDNFFAVRLPPEETGGQQYSAQAE